VSQKQHEIEPWSLEIYVIPCRRRSTGELLQRHAALITRLSRSVC